MATWPRTWVGSGERDGGSFHVCFSGARCWMMTGSEQGSAWSASVMIFLIELDCLEVFWPIKP